MITTMIVTTHFNGTKSIGNFTAHIASLIIPLEDARSVTTICADLMNPMNIYGGNNYITYKHKQSHAITSKPEGYINKK